jgi:hypothetical protein
VKYGFPVSPMLKSARDSLQRFIQVSESPTQQLERLGSDVQFSTKLSRPYDTEADSSKTQRLVTVQAEGHGR